VQRKVVIEEFKQRYLNQPYGNVWHKLRELAYTKHSYQWPTIGKTIKHIEDAQMEDVKAFFETYYVPNNAILVLAGNISVEKGFELAEKWFGNIPKGSPIKRKAPPEPTQMEKRFLEVHENVPVNAFYKVFHMPGKNSFEYYTADLLSDILGRGKSSLLYKELVETQPVFSELSSYVTGSVDPGLLVISGRLHKGISFEDAEAKVNEIVGKLITKGVESEDLEKAKNQALSTHAFGEVDLLERTQNLAYGFIVGDIDRTNKEPELLRKVTESDINQMAQAVLRETNASTLYYRALKN
jgi:zinc protease